MSHLRFAPFEALAEKLLPHAIEDSGDGSHDVFHIYRVWKNVAAISAEEGGNHEVLVASVILHDCISLAKDSPLRSQGSRFAAEKASGLLKAIGWNETRIGAVAHAIKTHSFSADVPPQTIEAKILQDADRLDAIGAVGVARCFYTAGRLKNKLYDPDDINATGRPYDDKQYTLDHFHTKLLKLSSTFQTATGAKIAQQRHDRLQRFLDEFVDEVS
jgi:uncharacterized protein